VASKKDSADYMKVIKITINFWIYARLKEFAKENDMSIRGAIRYIINQFFKNKPEY